MSAVARFGVLACALLYVAARFLPPPLRWYVTFSMLAIVCAIASVLTWRRTCLWLSSTGMGFAALIGVAHVLLIATGTDAILVGSQYWAIAVPAILVGPLLFFIEWRLHPHEWRRWRKHQESCSMLDWLTLRSIPDWRSDAVKSRAPR